MNIQENKTIGPDKIPTEFLKLLVKQKMDAVLAFFNIIYCTSIMPDGGLVLWLSTFVTLPKIQKAKTCKKYR